VKIVILDDDNQPTDVTDAILKLTIIDRGKRLPEYVRRLLARQVTCNKQREIVIDPSYKIWTCGGGG
jgi:hypothetical protein